MLLPLLVIAVFAAPSLERLAVLLVPAVLLLALSKVRAAAFWRPLYLLRWLFLCTVLLHLFFTPGRTLWGVGWLSLDGLLVGLLVCLQLALAVTFSSLLTMTTRAEELVGGGVALLFPLRRLGLPVERGGTLLLLVLHFIPLLGDEVVRLLAARTEPRPASLRGRLKALVALLEELLLRLVERAEALAQARVDGRGPDLQPTQGGVERMRTSDRLALLVAGFLVLLWVGWQ